MMKSVIAVPAESIASFLVGSWGSAALIVVSAKRANPSEVVGNFIGRILSAAS